MDKGKSDASRRMRLFAAQKLLLITGAMGLFLLSAASLSLVLSFLAPAASTASAVTSVPTLMNFQGRLTDSSGAAKADGTYNMRLRLYTVSSAGSSVWSEDRLVSASKGVSVTNGLFSIQIGTVTPLPASLFASGPLYLEVELPTPASATTSSPVWTEGAMSPRNQLATSAYAYNSETLDGLDSSAFGQLSSNNVWTGTNTFNGTTVVGSSALSGTAQSTIFNVRGGSLGSTVGNESIVASFGAATSNSDGLGISAYRATAGTDWTTANLILGRNVDSTMRAGAYLTFGNGSKFLGVNTLAPAYTLDVGGNINLTGNLTVAGTSVLTSGRVLQNVASITSQGTISGTQLISTVATGTAPLTVASTTKVTNLNADLLDGNDGTYYTDLTNSTGTLSVAKGGTGATTKNEAGKAVGTDLPGYLVSTVPSPGSTNGQWVKLATITRPAKASNTLYQTRLSFVGANENSVKDTNYVFDINIRGSSGTNWIDNVNIIPVSAPGTITTDTLKTIVVDDGVTAGTSGTFSAELWFNLPYTYMGYNVYTSNTTNAGSAFAVSWIAAPTLAGVTAPVAGIGGLSYSTQRPQYNQTTFMLSNDAVNDTQLSSNVDLLNTAQTITGAKTFNAAVAIQGANALTFGGDVSLSRTAANVLTLAAGDTLAVTGNQTIGGTLAVTGAITVTSSTKVANLNADLLDGMDSTAFGDATAANQTTILSRLGTNADAVGTGSVFARLAQIDDGDIGAKTDAASSTGSIFARLTDLYNRVVSLNTSISTLLTGVGNTGDAASTTGSMQAKLNWLIANMGSGSATANIGSPTDAADPNGSLFAQIRDIRQTLSTLFLTASVATNSVTSTSTATTVSSTVSVPTQQQCLSSTSGAGVGCPADGSMAFNASGGAVYAHTSTVSTTYGVVYATHTSPTLSDSVAGTTTTAIASQVSYNTTLTNLYANTTYHIRSYATTSAGTTYSSEQTLTTGMVGFIDAADGALIFYDAGSTQSWGRYLETSMTDQSTGVAWCSNTSTLLTGTTSAYQAIGAGKTNTATETSSCTSGAVYLASHYNAGGYTDWFLPSTGEWAILAGFGPQIGITSGHYYWSSSEASASAAYMINGSGGAVVGGIGGGGYSKTLTYYVRAIRAF